MGKKRVNRVVKKVMPGEPKRFVNLVKPCPRPFCGSEETTWRYYNNRQLSQPRYFCHRCKREFTLGGSFRISDQECTALLKMGEEAAAKAAAKALKKEDQEEEENSEASAVEDQSQDCTLIEDLCLGHIPE